MDDDELLDFPDLDSFFGQSRGSRNIQKKEEKEKALNIVRIKKLNVTDYSHNNTNLAKDLIEKINEIIMRVELIDAKCNGYYKMISRVDGKIKEIENNMLV